MAITVKFPKDGEGFQTEVKIGEDFQVVLRAVHSAVGPVMNIYNAKKKRWEGARYAGSMEDAKEQAETFARGLFKHGRHKGEFPKTLDWEPIVNA